MTNAQTVSLLEFCQTGTFATLTLGCTEAAMKNALGEPTAWANEPDQEQNYGHYGDVQFFFFNDELWLIHIDWFSGENNAPVLNAPHHLEPWVLRAGLDLQTARDALEQAGVGYAQRDEPAPKLHLESGVVLSFDLNDGDASTLGAISLSALTRTQS